MVPITVVAGHFDSFFCCHFESKRTKNSYNGLATLVFDLTFLVVYFGRQDNLFKQD